MAVNVDSGYEGYQHQQVGDACRERGWEFHGEHTNIGAVIDDKLESDEMPCSLCSLATQLEEFDDVPADVPLIPLMRSRPTFAKATAGKPAPDLRQGDGGQVGPKPSES